MISLRQFSHYQRIESDLIFAVLQIYMNELKAGVIINYVSIVVSLSTSFLLTPFVISKLGMEEYGLFMLSGSVISWLALTDMGLGATVRKYVTGFRARNEDREQMEFLGQATLLFTVLAFIVLGSGLICFFYLDVIFPSLTSEQHDVLQVLYLLTLGNMVIAFPLRPLTCLAGCYLKFIVPGIINLCTAIFNASLTILLLCTGYRAIGLTVLSVVMGVLSIILSLYYTVGVLGVRLRFTKPNWKLYREMFSFSFWVLLNEVMGILYWKTGAPIVARFCGASAVSLFTLGIGFASYYMAASQAIAGVIGPKIMRMVAEEVDREHMTSLMIRAGRLQMCLLCVVMLGFVVLGYDFLTLWVGKSIGEGVHVVWLGALIVQIPLLIPLTQNVGISLLQAMNIHKGRAIILLYSSIMCAIMGYTLTAYFGPIGMYIGTGISLLLGQGIMINAYYHRRAGLDMILFFKKTYWPVLLPAAIMILLGWGWISVWVIVDWLDFLISSSVYGIVCISAMFFFYLNKSERQMFIEPVSHLVSRIRKTC